MARACAGWLARRYGWEVPPAWITPLADVVAGLQAAIERFTPPGTPVVLPTPAYMPFLAVPGALGRELIQVPMVERDGRMTYDLDGIAAAFDRGARLLVHVNPHNPLGRVFDVEEQLALADVVTAAGARVFADEIHAPLVYPGAVHRPYASLSPETARHTVTATSTSKAWNVPGPQDRPADPVRTPRTPSTGRGSGSCTATAPRRPGCWPRRPPTTTGRGLAGRRPGLPRRQPAAPGRAARRAAAAGPVHPAGGHLPGLAGLPAARAGGSGRRLLPRAGRAWRWSTGRSAGRPGPVTCG